MKKSLLCWGALIVVALCFVGCCYYNTTHHHCKNCDKHCNMPCVKGDKAPAADNNDDTVETMTVEAVEIVPLQNNNAPANSKTPAAKQTAAPQVPTGENK